MNEFRTHFRINGREQGINTEWLCEDSASCGSVGDRLLYRIGGQNNGNGWMSLNRMPAQIGVRFTSSHKRIGDQYVDSFGEIQRVFCAREIMRNMYAEPAV